MKTRHARISVNTIGEHVVKVELKNKSGRFTHIIPDAKSHGKQTLLIALPAANGTSMEMKLNGRQAASLRRLLETTASA